METENDNLLMGDAEVIDLSAEEINVDSIKNEKHNIRRKRRRMMRNMLKPGAKPSFVALITPMADNEEEEEESAPKRIRIDVDEYLGLKKKTKQQDAPLPEAVPSNVMATRSGGGPKQAPSLNPADEGYFEGCIPVALPGEEQFLPELQTVIRSNLEIFSATEEDEKAPQPGRRQRIVRGKVGIRCIHCSKAIKENPSLPWPPGSVSYPLNIVGIYPCCSQKPQLHFQNCPYTPQHVKDRLQRLRYDEEGGPRARQRKTTPQNGDRSMSTVLYYTVAAKMIGLLDVASGIRFGRDLSLEPLPLESVRAQIEDEQAPYSRSVMPSSNAKPTPVLSTEPRITADVESERVLAQAVAEKDNDLLLAKSDDKVLVSDHIFLAIKQMAVCNATEADFATRGKKTKLMKIGFAGFCCRHCAHFKPEEGVVHYVDYSCRSFSSAADNLASAISNSFCLHLAKCTATPLAIRNALAAYKKLHSRQMAQMEHGSQRRLFQILWNRLRSHDLTKEQMEERMLNVAPPLLASASVASVAGSESSMGARPDDVSSASMQSDGRCGPICEDEETRKVLRDAEENWDPTVNDSLILPEDRNIVTDYVFLTMRQIKAAHPTEADFARGKRSSLADPSQPGLKCIHCAGQSQATNGRSFPSAPDNMSSTINSSMLHHMQKCKFVPEDIRRALYNLKRIHSAQCQSLRFGSQRRFFNLVFERLEKAPNDEQEIPEGGAAESQSMGEPEAASHAATFANDEVLAQCGFLETANGCFECQFCRMVSLSLRANDSISIGRPSVEFVQGHVKVCQKDALDLSGAAEALKTASEAYFAMGGAAILSSPLFGTVIRLALGGKADLAKRITDELMSIMIKEQGATDGNEQSISQPLNGLWNEFPSSVDCEAVLNAFKAFAETIQGIDSDLNKETKFLRFFRMISPSFVVPIKFRSANEDEPVDNSK